MHRSMADLTVFTFGDEPFISIRQSQGDEADELIRVHPAQVEVLIGWLRQAADEDRKSVV